jgi:hypothetical protein
MVNGDVLDIVVHKNIRLSNIVVFDILDSSPTNNIPHPGSREIKNDSAPLEKFTDCGRL